jgi:hypothetical protein
MRSARSARPEIAKRDAPRVQKPNSIYRETGGTGEAARLEASDWLPHHSAQEQYSGP